MRNGSPISYRTFDVPVAGGSLRAAMWGERGPLVFCAHGTSGNHTCFQALADQVGGEMRLLTADLRGRGRSNQVTGPWGMKAHADDVMALLDHAGEKKAEVLLGHSMGGFIGAVAAAQYPQRIGTLLMVDGGLPLLDVSFLRFLPFRGWITEKIVKKIIGRSLDRLDMTFESREANHAFWRGHPALANDWSNYIEQYIDYDIEGAPPALRTATRKSAILKDSYTQLIEPLVPDSLKALTCPVRFLRAERGLTDGAPLYPEPLLKKASARVRTFSSTTVTGVNHFTIMMSEHGARAVAQELRALLPKASNA